MSIKQIIEDTKSILQERGRCTGDLVPEIGGPVCLLGAVGLAAGVSELELNFGDYQSFSCGDAKEASEALALGIDSESDLDDDDDEWERPLAYELVYGFNDRTESDDEVYELLDSVIAGL